jgi:hypothetical protein
MVPKTKIKEYWWNDNCQKISNMLGKISAPLLIYQPQISNILHGCEPVPSLLKYCIKERAKKKPLR